MIAIYCSAFLQGPMHAEIAWEMSLIRLQHNTLLLMSGIVLLVMQSLPKRDRHAQSRDLCMADEMWVACLKCVVRDGVLRNVQVLG